MMQARRSAPDALGVALCGMGAATILGHYGESTTSLLLVAGALYGMHRVLASRAALWAISALAVIWLLTHFWELVPLRHPYELMNEHPTLYALPGTLRDLVWAALLVAVAVIGRPRTGTGLMVVTVVAIALNVLASLALRAFDDKESTSVIVTDAIAKGWGATATTLAAACFVAIAVSPAVEPLMRRVTTWFGVAGAALLSATLVGMPDHVSGGHDGATALLVLSLALAWVLSAVGLAGVARSGGGPAAWVGMGFSIAQVFALPVGGLAFADSMHALRAPMAMVLELGFFGIGLAALFAHKLGLGRARGLVGVLALVAVFGSFATLLRLATGHSAHTEDGLSALALYTYPVAYVAAALWAACLAYLVAPPRET